MEYTFKTKQMVEIKNKIGGFFELEQACYDDNIEVLAELMQILGNISEEKAFDTIDKELEKGKKINDLYAEIYQGINEKSFFKQVLEVDMKAPPMDTNKMMNEVYNKFLAKELEKAQAKNLGTLQNT